MMIRLKMSNNVLKRKISNEKSHSTLHCTIIISEAQKHRKGIDIHHPRKKLE